MSKASLKAWRSDLGPCKLFLVGIATFNKFARNPICHIQTWREMKFKLVAVTTMPSIIPNPLYIPFNFSLTLYRDDISSYIGMTFRKMPKFKKSRNSGRPRNPEEPGKFRGTGK